MHDLTPVMCRLYIAQQHTNIYYKSIFHLMEIKGEFARIASVDLFFSSLVSAINFLHRVMSGALY